MTISLNKNDRIRLIHAPDNVITTVEETVSLNWGKGIQEVSDKRPALFEIKLRGHPWWADGMIAEFNCYTSYSKYGKFIYFLVQKS